METSVTSEPTPEEMAVLSGAERTAFRIVHRMNQGRWKRFWTFFQRTLGSSWIYFATRRLLRVHGLEKLEAVSHERPLLLVANHRSFFDMYVVSAVLFRKTKWRKYLFFPVRGRIFYDSFVGMLINFAMGWWSMYPPIFTADGRRSFAMYSMRRLTELCREGKGHVIGFHPEGKRNLDPNPYTYLRAQPGLGKLVKEAAPQVIPVFIAGLGNNALKQIVGNWTGGETIRIHFGDPLDLSEYLAKKDHVRTYKEIGDFLMSRIAILGEADREMYALAPEGARRV